MLPTIDLPSISQELPRSGNSKSGTPSQIVSNHYMHGRVPNDTTTAVQVLKKVVLWYPLSPVAALRFIALVPIIAGRRYHLPERTAPPRLLSEGIPADSKQRIPEMYR